jgi:outer membrane receptor protein involved in Fe transport
MFRTFAVFAAMLLLAAFAVTAVAQTTATITGTVHDESGNIFPGATITATNTANGFTHTATSGPDGRYTLAGVPAASYRIDVAAPSYKGASKEVRVLVGQNLDLNFRLTPDLVLMEQITVVGATAVETETSEIATNVTPRQMESLPQNDRNFLNFAALAPGVSLGTDEQRKEVRAGAQGSSATNVFIDGVSFKNDVIQGGVIGQDASRGNPFPQNAVQEFRVITQNYSAEYQKASSAIITAVTKSGSNTLTGDAFFFFQDKGLVAKNPLNGANPQYSRNQYGLSVGGPIIRDRMHFFASYEANDQDREETVNFGSGWDAANPTLASTLRSQFGGVFTQPFRSDLFFGKLSFQPGSAQIVDGSVNLRKETDVRGFGGETSRDSAENAKNDAWGANLRHQYTNASWLNEASVSYQTFEWNPTPLDDNSIGFVYEGLGRIGGRDTEQDIGQDRLAFRDDVTLSSAKWHGNHTFKVGGNAEFLDYTVTKHFEENPRFFYRPQPGAQSALIPYRARWGFGDPDLSADNQQYGIYSQDDWAFNDKLTLNLGLRWDYETNMINTDYVTPADVRARLSDSFPANYFTDGNDREPKTDMFQPRLGFSYDVFASGKTVVFGGAGRYYDRNLFNNTLDEQFRLQHFVGDFFFTPPGTPATANSVPWDPKYLSREGLAQLQALGQTGKPEVFLVENDTKVPYSNQWNLGVRQAFGSMVASVSYASIRSYNGFSYLWGTGVCCPNPPLDPNYSNVLISSDDVRTWYDAVYVQFDRPYTDESHYGFNVAYTWADAEQVGGDLFSLDKPTIADWPRYGTPGTQDHRLVANAIVGVPFGIRLSTLVQYSSGDRFRIHDWSRDFCFNCYQPRTGEGPSYTLVDLRADYGVNVGRQRIGFIVEAFNILNQQRPQDFESFQGPVRTPADINPNIGKVLTLVGGSQRRYQFGIRYGF